MSRRLQRSDGESRPTRWRTPCRASRLPSGTVGTPDMSRDSRLRQLPSQAAYSPPVELSAFLPPSCGLSAHPLQEPMNRALSDMTLTGDEVETLSSPVKA